jgi:hypothetical protein
MTLRRRPPIHVAADMTFHQLLAPKDGEWLGTRIDGASRVIVWRLPNGMAFEQRMPVSRIKRQEPVVEVTLTTPDGTPPLRVIRGEKK